MATTTADRGDDRSHLEDSIRTILGGDHQRLEESFQTIVAAADGLDPSDLHEAWQVFEQRLLTHLEAEEKHVLPTFEKYEPAEAHDILEGHARIRERLLQLAIDLDLHCLRPDRVKGFVDELRAHAAREERVLYPWAARQLSKIVGVPRGRSPAPEAADGPPVQSWRIDLARSTLRFSLRHVVVRQIAGQFKRWGGTIVVDEVDPIRSRLHVWVDLASLDTGDPSRDAQARSPEFFDVDRFPRATFASTQVRLPDLGNPTVQGRLRLHGVEAEMALEIIGREERKDPDGSERAVYTVTGRLDRRDFGLRWNRDLDVGGIVVGEQVQIDAHVEAIRQRSP
ncbi:MAG TPA: YceI family protein [Polyangia bacterium]|nr:YceI family protein [Polyangia bacterium]